MFGRPFSDNSYKCSTLFPDTQLATNDLLNAAAILVASGNFTAEAAVTKVFELDTLIKKELLKGLQCTSTT
jgi:hypothetical protein